MPTLTHIATANPPYKHEQKDILAFMLGALELTEKQSRLLSLQYYRSGISNRFSVLSDFSPSPKHSSFFIQNGAFINQSIEKRMNIFGKEALDLSEKVVLKLFGNSTKPEDITHLITVTCTGLSAPGLDIQLMEVLGLPKTIIRTSVNFMGCYAALHALKIANAFATNDKNANVLVVCTELCTIHFQNSTKQDQLTSSLLFGDGSAACIISGDESKNGLRVKNFFSKVYSNGKTEMAWNLSSTGFEMVLSNHIPKLVKEEISNLIELPLKNSGLEKDNIQHWAIHPGGKDILGAVEKALNLKKENLAESYTILNNYGNMSSPTILFVLEEIIKKASKQELVMSAAFGPGLTIESVLFEVA